MKKITILFISALFLLTSCGTYTGQGAYVGTSLGSILGSAIGGITGGPRGADLGTVVGMVGGAVVGGAIGNAADKKQESDLEQYQYEKQQRRMQRAQRDEQLQNGGDDLSGFDAQNGGDDRIYDFNSDAYNGNYSALDTSTRLPGYSSLPAEARNLPYIDGIEIKNVRFDDENGDNSIGRGELCKIIFEVYNHTKAPLSDLQPLVIETTGNKYLSVSPSMHIERLNPGAGIRYTAMIQASNRLKKGQVRICMAVVQGNNNGISKVSELTLPTVK